MAVRIGTMPRVTVILATYNWSSVLPYSIGSVLAQTFTDFELLVVGDACTDDSEQVVAKITDPRVRWINLSENSGIQSGPNNEGLKQARGEFIAYIGHDDLWFPHHLETLITVIEEGADLAYGIVELVDPDQKVQAWPRRLKEYEPGQWIPPSGVLHRKSVTEQIGSWKFPGKIALPPDIELWLRMHEGGFKLRPASRLSVIKFAAAQRRDVYKERPCHEQKAWSARITSEPHLERDEVVRMLVAEKELLRFARLESMMGYRKLFKAFVIATRNYIRRIVGIKPPVDYWKPKREFKGLPPKTW